MWILFWRHGEEKKQGEGMKSLKHAANCGAKEKRRERFCTFLSLSRLARSLAVGFQLCADGGVMHVRGKKEETDDEHSFKAYRALRHWRFFFSPKKIEERKKK